MLEDGPASEAGGEGMRSFSSLVTSCCDADDGPAEPASSKVEVGVRGLDPEASGWSDITALEQKTLDLG